MRGGGETEQKVILSHSPGKSCRRAGETANEAEWISSSAMAIQQELRIWSLEDPRTDFKRAGTSTKPG